MAYQEFIVLYTHQKTKKSKVWQDGILKAAFGGNKANLFDDKGQLLDSIFIKFQIKPGDDFESERYLITVESENVSKTDYNQSKNTEKGKLRSNSLKSLATSSLCHPKRKSVFKQSFAEAYCPEDVQIPCLHSDSPNLVVEFHGYQVKGSAASKMMTRKGCLYHRKDPQSDMTKSESASKDAFFFLAQELNCPGVPEFVKLLSKQWVSSQTTGCHFFPTPNSKETIEEQELLISKTYPDLYMDNKKPFFRMYPENDMSILLPTLGTQTPVVPGFIDNLLSDFQLYSSANICKQIHHHCGFSVVNTYDKSEMLEPEDRMCKFFVGGNYIGVRDKIAVQSTLPNVSEQKEQSKWQKYHNITGCDLRSQNCNEVAMASDIKAESYLGMSLEYRRENQSNVIYKSPLDSEHLETIKSMLCKQQQNFITQDSVSERKKLSLHLNQHFCTEEVLSELGHLSFPKKTRDRKDTSELHFPRVDMVKNTNVPKRQQRIPVEFQSPAHYKKVFTIALIEHLNILLFELSKNLHKALGKVDISFYSSVKEGQRENSAPLCSHKIAAKLLMVRKEGRNKGRLFYACDAAKADRCDFFKWLEDVKPVQMESKPCIILHDIKSIGTYLRCQRISIYEECQLLIRKMFDTQRKLFGKMKRCDIAKANFDCDSKRKLFLKLNRKEHSSTYSKDDLWVVSKTLTFEPLDTFIAYSVFFGPSSNNEVELEHLNGYSPSNWRSDMIVHALFVCNASTELTNLRNIQENVSSITLPIMQHLLTKKELFPKTKERKQKFKPPGISTNAIKSDAFSPEIVINLADKIIQAFQLNKDQVTAMMQIGAMMTSQEINTETAKHPTFPITIIHGVFGSGKSLLLAIVILFLTQIFEIHEAANDKRSVPWKILVSSSTNVAVDRILLSLLDIGFEDFIRVGSIKKIAKPILPYSLHADLRSENEQLKELLALMKEDLSPVEKMYVKKTIEQHKLGTNKASLRKVKVVGSTCAACSFPCLKSLKFPIVILDECSQMTEPSSLLPIASFECEKLILVGDPKQLPPTIQGSESAHDSGLEQTLFDRLCLMGYAPILLRTQYRCHPVIAAITNELFYEGILLNGISEIDRSPLLDWLPTLCFYNVNGSEQIEADNSFYNMAESFFIVKLIQSLVASGIDGSMIGIITLYKSQMNKIRNLFGAVHMDAAQIKAVQVSTVDAFQGAEKEIIVLSCVRTRQVGFIDSEKRVNVALTRGKRHLLIVGNLNCLRKNKLWGSVIQHCTGRKNGFQHANQCEQQLNDIVKSYFKRKMEEEAIMKKKKSKNESLSQKTNA
ncbi:protein ZGRF1 [Notechis scutatus]|uniref:5'-3' DNA helicase ZGRF1 n=1 Tax=Notechis scutatus TaxID=8663 RepID=A0A6J1U0Z5_9SAUR|nr:protein ZGRF1 [Notechis scutatus]